MSEEEKLDFSLPERKLPGPRKGGGVVVFLTIVAVLLLAANLYLTWSQRGGDGALGNSGNELPAGDLKKLALKLEKQGLGNVASEAWVEYLAAAEDDVDPAAVWYRIGILRQEAGSHEDALAAFYRAESLGCEGLEGEIGRRVRNSLEELGKFAALRTELTERVGLDKESAAEGDDVVAEIGALKITRVELDRQIEAVIENQLAMMAGQLPEAQRRQQKEAMLKQVSTDQQRLQLLQSYIVEEILYRKARESKLVEDPEMQAQLRNAERSLLARKVMEDEMAGKVTITDGDLSIYYDARKSNYVEPESAELSQIVVAGEEEAKELIGKVKAGEDFAGLAGEHSLDEAAKEKGGELVTPLVKGRAMGGLSAELLAPVFETGEGEVVVEPLKSEAGYHVIKVRKRNESRQKPFEEVRQQIYQELRSQKEREVQAQLLESLRNEYDVVIHQEKFGGPSDEK